MIACPRPISCVYSRRISDLVALLRQAVCKVCCRNPHLDRHIAARRIQLGESRSLQRRLQIHPVIDDVRNKLRVRQRLIESAHDAEPGVHIALFHERRNNRVQGTLAAREHIRMLADRA